MTPNADAKLTQKSVPRCYWCDEPATGRDHVLPLNLFPKPAPTTLITVPACDAHNGDLTLDEEYFRALVVAGKAYEKPAGRKLWDERVLPRLADRIGLRRRLIGQMRLADVRTPSGLYGGQVDVIEAEEDRVNRVVEKMVRGLYFHHIGQRLEGATVRIWHDPRDPLMALMKKAKRFDVGGGIVRYAYGVSTEDARASIWWILLFESTYFLATTLPELLDDDKEATVAL